MPERRLAPHGQVHEDNAPGGAFSHEGAAIREESNADWEPKTVGHDFEIEGCVGAPDRTERAHLSIGVSHQQGQHHQQGATFEKGHA